MCTNTQANCQIIYGVRSYKEQLKYDLKALHYIFFRFKFQLLQNNMFYQSTET